MSCSLVPSLNTQVGIGLTYEWTELWFKNWSNFYNIWEKHEIMDDKDATTPPRPVFRAYTLIILNKNKEAYEEFWGSDFLYNTLLVSHSSLLKRGGVRGWSGKIYSSKKLTTHTLA